MIRFALVLVRANLTQSPYSMQSGVMFEITREDGYPFSAATLNVRYHNKPVESYWNRRLGLTL